MASFGRKILIAAILTLPSFLLTRCISEPKSDVSLLGTWTTYKYLMYSMGGISNTDEQLVSDWKYMTIDSEYVTTYLNNQSFTGPDNLNIGPIVLCYKSKYSKSGNTIELEKPTFNKLMILRENELVEINTHNDEDMWNHKFTGSFPSPTMNWPPKPDPDPNLGNAISWVWTNGCYE
jgi:hypothetical protein